MSLNFRGLVVPMYGAFPSFAGGAFAPNSTWAELESVARHWGGRLALKVVLNPLNGPGLDASGRPVDEGTSEVWRRTADRLVNVGIEPLGYVATAWLGQNKRTKCLSWGSDGECQRQTRLRWRILRAIQREIRQWRAFYGVSALFLDEVCAERSGPRAVATDALAAALAPDGASVWNLGARCQREFTSWASDQISCELENQETVFALGRPALQRPASALVLLHHASEGGSPGFEAVCDELRRQRIAWFFSSPRADWHHPLPTGWIHALVEGLDGAGLIRPTRPRA